MVCFVQHEEGMTQNNFLANLLKGTLSLTKTVNVNEVSGGLEKKYSILIQGDAGKIAALTPAELITLPATIAAIEALIKLGAYNQPVAHWDGTYGWKFLGDWGASDGAILVHRAFVSDRAAVADRALVTDKAALADKATVADRALTVGDAAGNLTVPGVIQSMLASNPGFQWHKPGVFGAQLLLDDTNWLSTQGWSAGAGFTSMRVGNLQVNGGLWFGDYLFPLGGYNQPTAHWDGTYGYRHLGDWVAGGNGVILVHRAAVADRAQTADGAAGGFIAMGAIQSQMASNPGFQFHKPGVFGAELKLDDTNWLSTQGWSSGAGFASLRVGNLQVNGGIFFPDGSVQTTAGAAGIDWGAVDARIAAAINAATASILGQVDARINAAMVQVDGKIAAAINAAMAQVDAKIAAATASILSQVDAKIAAAIANSPSPSPAPAPSPTPVSIGNILGPIELSFQTIAANQGDVDPIVRIKITSLKPISTWREWLAAGKPLRYYIRVLSDYPGDNRVYYFDSPHADLFDANGNFHNNIQPVDRAFKWLNANYTASIFAIGDGQTSPVSSKGFAWG